MLSLTRRPMRMEAISFQRLAIPNAGLGPLAGRAQNHRLEVLCRVNYDFNTV